MRSSLEFSSVLAGSLSARLDNSALLRGIAKQRRFILISKNVRARISARCVAASGRGISRTLFVNGQVDREICVFNGATHEDARKFFNECLRCACLSRIAFSFFLHLPSACYRTRSVVLFFSLSSPILPSLSLSLSL